MKLILAISFSLKKISMTEMAGARKWNWNLKFEPEVIILSYKVYAAYIICWTDSQTQRN